MSSMMREVVGIALAFGMILTLYAGLLWYLLGSRQ